MRWPTAALNSAPQRVENFKSFESSTFSGGLKTPNGHNSSPNRNVTDKSMSIRRQILTGGRRAKQSDPDFSSAAAVDLYKKAQFLDAITGSRNIQSLLAHRLAGQSRRSAIL
jgi:hypothetical protein